MALRRRTRARRLSHRWSALQIVHDPDTSAPLRARNNAADLLACDGLPFSKKLLGHRSCVNSLAFSPGGRWLASAGDDPYIHLWDFHQDEVSSPAYTFLGPVSNVFTLAFSASGQFLYSGDTRNMIFQYDISSLPSVTASASSHKHWLPLSTHNDHQGSIRAISCHPENESIYLSASEDGRIILHDARLTRSQATLQNTAEFTGLQYHPTMAHVFATSDSRGRVCLRDARMAFGPLIHRHARGVVHKYVTTLSKPSTANVATPEASSVAFDRTGRRLAVTMLHHVPTIYSLNDPYPIATCSAPRSPTQSDCVGGGYSNSCTMKHGSFGSLGAADDGYYAAGSDDFRTYIWKLPPDAALLEQCEVVDPGTWQSGAYADRIGYTPSSLAPRYLPCALSAPHCRLTGHQSIVNSALFHPHRPLVLSAGIERYVRLHGVSRAGGLARTPRAVREVPAEDPRARSEVMRAMLFGGDDGDAEGDDAQTLALFDEIVRQEGGEDVFAHWSHSGNGGESDEDSEDESMRSERSDEDEDALY